MRAYVLRLGLLSLSSSLLLVAAPLAALGPQSGDVYKEFASYGGNWRVTDRATIHTSEYPNSTYYITIDDLDGAVGAEATVVRWGGHTGTSRRRIAFGHTNTDNNAQFLTIPASDWITLPEISAGVCYMHFDTPTVAIPLAKIHEGSNSFVLDCGPQICHSFNWGQWGFYGMLLRVYYDPATKTHPTGVVASPTNGVTLVEDPVIVADVTGDVDRVDFVGYYDGLDLNGDGDYLDWHEFYFRPKESSGTSPGITGHIGTATDAPWQVTWSTTHVPDQTGNPMKIAARIRGANGLWYVTPAVTGLDLHRPDETVKLYKPQNVPTNFWVRNGQTKQCTLSIGGGDDLGEAIVARMHWRTWAETFASVTLNGLTAPSTGGGGHELKYTLASIGTNLLQNGTNTIRITNASVHHGCEVMYPGPMLTIRYNGGAGDVLPVADAGADRTVADSGGDGYEVLVVDGSASIPPPGGSITSYLWTHKGTLVGTNAVAVAVLPMGVHMLVLTVTADNGAKTVDTVTISVANLPNANAGPDQSLLDSDGDGYSLVTLDGSASTPGDHPIAGYLWRNGAQYLGSSATVLTALTIGTHTLTLEVTDTEGQKATDTCVVTVEPAQAATPGDADSDGDVDLDDFTALKLNFGRTNGVLWSDGDFDGDGDVDLDDFILLKLNFGQ